VIGVDILPATPPRGVSTIQGDFLSPAIQAEVRSFVQDPTKGRTRPARSLLPENDDDEDLDEDTADDIFAEKGYIEMERSSRQHTAASANDNGGGGGQQHGEAQSGAPPRQKDRDAASGRVVDVVLSDMSEPWEQTTGFHKRSISDPYHRMMNTSGMAFRDHAGSMDLCAAALEFGFDTLRAGGHFVCKFYQGAEDKLLEKKLKRLFEKVHREKPAASRSVSISPRVFVYVWCVRFRGSKTQEDSDQKRAGVKRELLHRTQAEARAGERGSVCRVITPVRAFVPFTIQEKTPRRKARFIGTKKFDLKANLLLQRKASYTQAKANNREKKQFINKEDPVSPTRPRPEKAPIFSSPPQKTSSALIPVPNKQKVCQEQNPLTR